jgi:translation initiation factor eIF-2B subunit epsilon
VFCCAHADQVEAHLHATGWFQPSKFSRLSIVTSSGCLSVGDALRVLDHQDTIKSDFILVSGDVVSNMKLAPALEAHRRRRAADRSAVLTMVMKGTMGEGHRARLGDAACVAALDPDTHRLLKVVFKGF